ALVRQGRSTPGAQDGSLHGARRQREWCARSGAGDQVAVAVACTGRATEDCLKTMAKTLFESTLTSLPLLHRGKVRDIYAVDSERLLIVQTDRLSAFDVILPTPVPGKGEILTALSKFWFRRLGHVIPNHLLDDTPESLVADNEREQVAGRAFVVRR